MKVLDRQTFLLQKEGIFFSRGEKWALDGFFVKGNTIFDDTGSAIDFFYTDLCSVESLIDADDSIKKMEYSLVNGMSVRINQSEQRDGCFDDEEIFMTFDKEDLKIIRMLIDRILINK